VRALPRLERNQGADVKRLQGLLVAKGHKLPNSTMEPSTANSVMRPTPGWGFTSSRVVDSTQWKLLGD
jgi:hypothetical protein